MKVSRREALTDMAKAKNEFRQCFFFAELTEPVLMREWNGQHPVDENTEKKMATEGCLVLVTVYSRFGDVGIRMRNLDDIDQYGYDARVDPEILVNWEKAYES